jgi:cell division protein FtsQ
MDPSAPHDFIDREEVLSIVNAGKIKGNAIGSINISLLEKKLMSNSFVEKAEVYSTVDGKLQISVLQRNPLVRIINMNDEHFYIDRNGKFMPVSDRYSTPVIVASGYIYDAYSMMQVPQWAEDSAYNIIQIENKPVINQVFEVAAFLAADTFWNAQTEQIYVNESREIELIPRIGSHKIILGSTEDLEEKFSRLYIFYTRGLKHTGWNNYSIINLKYKNQVVCTKLN